MLLRLTVTPLVAATMLVIWANPARAVEPAVKCEAGKLKEAGKYANCRMKAESKAVKKGLPPDYSKCVEKFGTKWEKTETNAQGACPTNGDQTAVESAVTACMTEIAAGLGCGGAAVGGACWFLGDYGESCDTVCANAGLSCNLLATRDFVGSGGSVANCEAVATAMELTLAAPGLEATGFDGFGCVYYIPTEQVVRTTSPTTTCEADGSAATFPRFCACD